MKKKILIGLALCFSLCFISCGKSEVSSEEVSTPASISETVSSEDTTSVEAPSDSVTDEPTMPGKLSENELSKITDFIRKSYNYGFLMSTYADVADVDLGPIFYNGDVINEIPEDEFEFLWKRFEGTEGGSLTVISEDEMQRIMAELTGINSLDEFNRRHYLYMDGWNYSYEYNCYYRCVGDVNYMQFEAVDGFYSDGIIVAKVRETDFTNMFAGQNYYPVTYELALRPVNDSYQFVSCRQLYDDGIITDNCYELTLSSLGESMFFTYEPVSKYGDVTFKVIHKGEIFQTLYSGNETNSVRPFARFESIEDMGFCDFNNDGYPDMICIANYYDETANMAFRLEKVYYGTEEGYFYYNRELNEFVNQDRKPKDVASETEFLKDQNMFNPDWRSVYFDLINSLSDDELGVMGGGGFAVINIDGDIYPEIAVYGNCEASGSKLITYAEGKGQFTYFNRLYFTYMPEYGLVNNCEGHMGYYYDNIYKMENTYLVPLACGTYSDDYAYYDEYDNLVGDFVYTWNGESVTGEEYERLMSETYDSKNNYTKHVDPFSFLEYDELVSMLNCEYRKIFE